jgi:hypothetical protein
MNDPDHRQAEQLTQNTPLRALLQDDEESRRPGFPGVVRLPVPVVAWEGASNEAGEAAIRTGPASGRGQRQHQRHEFMHGA